ncbi:hypothetical protein AGMMS49965_18200 [Bacteroidia bacterium]|nr:hypothetical protein AGMMS49965_18200 [Bacteroidia bacterium]
MKKIALILSTLALLASGCGNKKVPVDDSTLLVYALPVDALPFDYSTLPTRWIELVHTGIDGEFAVCNRADEVLIEGNELVFLDLTWDEGAAWSEEILDSYQINDTIVLNLKNDSRKIVWIDRERGVAEWLDELNNVYTFVTNENLSKFPKINCYGVTEEEIRLVDVETKSKNPEDLVCSDDSIFEKTTGDLNKDGEDDCVILTKQREKSAFVPDEYYGELNTNRRGIVIAFKEGEEYNTVLAFPECFPAEHPEDAGYVAAEIKKGNLLIHFGYGRYGWCRYTFRYRNSAFELIGYDKSSSNGPVEESIISINFLTKKKQELVNTDPEADSGGEVFEETWKDIELTNGIVKLTDIRDFDEFRINSCYVEK